MSKDKAEYDVFKGLLNNSQKNTLSSQIVLEAVRKRCIEELGDSQKIYLLHDRCDIRKPYSSELEGLGKQIISGYDTFNSFALELEAQKIVALSHETYSNRLDNYVSQQDLELIANKAKNSQDLLDK